MPQWRTGYDDRHQVFLQPSITTWRFSFACVSAGNSSRSVRACSSCIINLYLDDFLFSASLGCKECTRLLLDLMLLYKEESMAKQEHKTLGPLGR